MALTLTLFVHIVGMLTLFVGLGLEWASLDGLQRSVTREHAQPWLRLVVMVPRVSGIADTIDAPSRGSGVARLPAGRVADTSR